MALRLQMSVQQQTQKTMPQNGSQTAHRVNPSPKIGSAAEKIPCKVCSFPAKELQVLGKDGPFHRERTEPLGQTKVVVHFRPYGVLALSLTDANSLVHGAWVIAVLLFVVVSCGVWSQTRCHIQIGPHKVELNDMPDGASMRDCIFRAHDDRFLDIVGDSPEIVRLAKKEHDFAHEVAGASPCSPCDMHVPAWPLALLLLQMTLHGSPTPIENSPIPVLLGCSR